MTPFEVETSKEGFVDKKAIEDSDCFMVIMTKNWVQEPLRLEEFEYAKSLGKSIAVAVFDGVDPEPYLKDAKVIVKRVFSREQVASGTPLAKALIQDFIEEVEEKLDQLNKEAQSRKKKEVKPKHDSV